MIIVKEIEANIVHDSLSLSRKNVKELLQSHKELYLPFTLVIKWIGTQGGIQSVPILWSLV